ncbi:hypothetical protein ACF0H5_017867 [Mactra antiquata]
MATGGRSVSKTSEECFDFICTSCDRENKTLEAVRYCVECSGYCCQLCTDMHKKFPALSNHNLLDVSQGKQAGNQQPRLPEFPTERCGTHHGKVLDMYCKKHNVVGCSTCISKDHRSCPDSQIYSIPEMINTLFNLSNSKQTQSILKDLMNSMSSISDSKDDQLATLIKARNEALKEITKFQKALETAVKKGAEISKKVLENTYKKLEEEILHDKAEVQKTKDALQNSSKILQKAEGNRAQRFVCTKLAETQMKEADDQMSKRILKNLEDVQLLFTPNQSLMNYINGLHGIGEVVGRTKKRTDLYKVKGSTDINIRLTDDSSSGNMYVGDCRNGIVCFDDAGNYLSTYNDNDLSATDGVCVDGRGNILVVGCLSNNVVQFNEDGKKIGVVIKQQDGLQSQLSVCFHQKLNRLFVSMVGSDVLKIYELE